MEIFVTLKEVLKVLGILEIKGPRHSKFIRILLSLFTVLTQLYTILTIGWYFAFHAQTFAERAESAHVASAAIYSVVTFYVIWSQRDRLMDFLDKIRCAVARREAMFARNIYVEACKTVEKLSYRTQIPFVCVIVPGFVAPAIVLSYIDYYVLDKPAEVAFKLPTSASYPYEWRTPITYFFNAIAFTIQISYVCIIVWTFACLFLGVCTFFMAFVKDLSCGIDTIEREIQAGTKRKRITFESRQSIRESVYDFIATHSEAKQMASECSDVYKPMMITYFYCCGFAWCIGLLILNEFIVTKNHFMLVTAIATFALLPFLAMICYVGERVRTEYLQLHSSIYNVCWYLCPMDSQKLFTIILMQAERPVTFESVAGLDCSHGTFKVIIKCGYSFFMTLRKFG